MLTDKDIQKLKAVFATKDDFEYFKVKVSNIESIVIKLDEKIEKIDKRDFEDSSTLASTVLDHDRSIKILERFIKA